MTPRCPALLSVLLAATLPACILAPDAPHITLATDAPAYSPDPATGLISVHVTVRNDGDRAAELMGCDYGFPFLFWSVERHNGAAWVVPEDPGFYCLLDSGDDRVLEPGEQLLVPVTGDWAAGRYRLRAFYVPLGERLDHYRKSEASNPFTVP